MIFVVADAIQQQPVFLKAQAIECVGGRATLLGIRNADDLCLGRHDARAQPE